jgi:sporulation protein YunB
VWCFPKKRRSYLKCNREKQKLTKKQKFGIIVASFLLVIIGILLYLNYVVNPVIIHMSGAKVRSLATKAVGGAIYTIVSQNDVYNDLIKITYDDKGNVKTIQANSIGINLLTRSLTRLAQSNLEQIGNEGINIPLGSFSGLPILVGRGPSVNIKLIPIGAISSSFSSEFTSAGINQTHHKIYVTISSNISIVLPTANQTIQTSTQVLICENIIIGEVPPTYLNSDSLDEMMNLIPS